ncbi:MAG: SDR family oxidoreductase [Luminiphilus sp.]|jgi:NAD(P)-dependent dehydrogenase (short-subunit alcohol dehydrogenase family)|nr:SDR family oxidoreductase [Luminiphilus sp.]MDG2443333.1 SDR family oxidoreductase [Luminiphilus sp.]
MGNAMDYQAAFQLHGKVAIVTGAGGNLGAETCAALVSVGASVVATDVNEQAVQAVADNLIAEGGSVVSMQHDVTREAEWEAAVELAIASFGGLDVVVNAAAIVPMNLLSALDVEEFRRVQDVNVSGTLLGCKHGLRAMRPDGVSGRGGSIINLSSVMGLSGSIALASYNASKGAVRLLTKSVAAECAMLKTNIRCNSIHPGIIDSDMGSLFYEQLTDLGVTPSMEAAAAGFLSAVPMGEPGLPSDIAAGVVYLASDASRYVTGSELVIDGGFYAT